MIEDRVITQIKKNIFYRSIQSIENYQSFDWHRYKNNIDTDQVNSSQALAIDFWGCLKLSRYKDQLINTLFDKSDNSWSIQFEFEDTSLLSEKKKSTQIDILIANRENALFVESKFTEKAGGSCSQINKTKDGVYQCNGNYEIQINPKNEVKSRCALSGKGIKYWDFIDELTEYSKRESYSPCPFKKGEYQWMRNICFAKAYAMKNNVKVETYLVYLKSDKCAISKEVKEGKYLGNLKGKINDKSAFKPISYNDLVEKCISFLEIDTEEQRIWKELKQWILKKEESIGK